MSTIAKAFNTKKLRELATKSNYKLGEEIAEHGSIEYTEFSPWIVSAKVGAKDTQSRTAELQVNGDKMSWKCTCTKKPHYMCKHVVALALDTRRKVKEAEGEK